MVCIMYKFNYHEIKQLYRGSKYRPYFCVECGLALDEPDTRECPECGIGSVVSTDELLKLLREIN
jgi:ribosomal protein S27AE